ncbi:MAG: hypothetical protein K2L45_09210 [Muribaculaceae bacterium]|nr:hypothetical protein [Muribaculaceae bacterium]
MNEERKTYMSDEDIECLLSPKCDFHTSPGFMERVLAEAHVVSKRRRLRRIFLSASSSAAAVALLVMVTVIFHHDKKTHSEVANVSASLETPVPALSDTLHKIISSELFAESKPTKINISSVSKKSTTKSAILQKPSLMQSMKEEVSDESEPHAVTEGAMPMINQEKSLDPDEVRIRLIETSRNAEIAFIEQMRDEIESNEAYIAQLMDEENVYQ